MVILCTIDLETREVSLPAGQVIASYDHNVDVIRFQAEAIPGFSLDTSSIKIAAQGPNKARHDYAVDPSTVQIEEETGYITFDWPIPAGVTEMPIGTFKYGDKGNLIFAVCAEIIDGSTVSKAWHSDDGIITVVAHLEPESGGGEDPEEEATNAQKIAQLQTNVAVMGTQVGALANGSPTPVATVAEMTDESAVYLYTGSETGYTAGNWYYWNGTAWTSGGTYGGAVTDTTLSISGSAADAKAVGDALAGKADADDVTAVEGDIDETNERLGDLESGFKWAVYDGTMSDFQFVQGNRTVQNPLVIDSTKTDRCTLNVLINAKKGDEIACSGVSSGQRYAIFGSPSYNSGWITADFTLTVQNDGVYGVNIGRIDGGTITPVDVSLTVNAIDHSSIVSKDNARLDGLSGFVREAHYDYESNFISGTRTTQDPSVVVLVGPNNRCTTATVITLESGDTINISGDVTGLKYALVALNYDSGWKYGEFSYTSQNGGNYFVNVAKTSDDAISPTEVTLQITVKPYSSWIYKTVDNADLAKRNLFGEKINMPYELGAVSYKNNEPWLYGNSDTMVRTPQNGLVHLYKGTIVGLTDYTDARYYIGWFRPDGTSTFSYGWKTSDFLVTEEGYYSLLVSNLTPTSQTSAEALGSLISIKAMDILADVFDSKSHINELNINPYILNSKFIAHRGCDSASAPENTIPAFKWAIDSGYKILEYDIRFTSDGVPVLIHDETINRTARNQDGTEISTDIYVANSSYEELLNYDFGIWRGSDFAGTKIPTLEEFLVFIKKYGCCGDTDWTTLGSSITSSQIATFMSTVKKTGMMGSVMITSNIDVIRNLLLEYPNILVCVANQGSPLSTLDNCAAVMASARLPIVSLQYPYAEKGWHEYAHNLGLYTKTFTPSTNEEINTSLGFSPDLMIVGRLKRDEIVIN